MSRDSNSRENHLTIGNVASRTGLSPRQIRYLEKTGIVSFARSQGGQRLFSEADVEKLASLRDRQEKGESLGRIRLARDGDFPPAPEQLKIGDIADLTGLSARSLRHYEELEIISPGRSEGGTRSYSADDLDIARIIAELRSAGVSVADISRLATERRKYATGREASSSVGGLIDRMQVGIERKMEVLDTVRQDLARAKVLVAQCRNCDNAPNQKACPNCPLETSKDQSSTGRLIWDH